MINIDIHYILFIMLFKLIDNINIWSFKNRYQLIYVYKLLKICIFIADSAKFKVLKDKYFNKRHKNSNKIFLIFYMNDSSISLYNIHKNQAIFKDSSQKPHPHILKLLTYRISSRTIHTINRHHFWICIKFTYHYCLHFILKSCSLLNIK